MVLKIVTAVVIPTASWLSVDCEVIGLRRSPTRICSRSIHPPHSLALPHVRIPSSPSIQSDISLPRAPPGECKSLMQEYMACMKANNAESGKCRGPSRRYLECRMEKGLMERDEMTNLGFRERDDKGEEGDKTKAVNTSNSSPTPTPTPSSIAPRERLV